MSLLAVALLTLCSLGSAAEQTLSYDLEIDGKPAGKRDVTLNFIQEDGDEVRIVQSYTELKVTLPGALYVYRNRASGRAGTGSPGFTSSVDEDGTIREVQGRRTSDRSWRVTLVEGGETQAWKLRPSQVTLTSLDLLDPERHELLTMTADAAVLVVETGAISSGPVTDLGVARVRVGGDEVEGHRWGLDTEDGRWVMAWSSEGVLLGYETRWMGKTLTARLRALPPPASFGDVEVAPVLGTGLSEESL